MRLDDCLPVTGNLRHCEPWHRRCAFGKGVAIKIFWIIYFDKLTIFWYNILMNKKHFNALNDFFVRYFFRNMRAVATDKGGEKSCSTLLTQLWLSQTWKLLKKGEQYDDLTPVISINLLNFNLSKKNDNVHSCYMIYDTKSRRLLTDHLQIHMIELKKI